MAGINDDLSLKDLNQFCGTEQYHRFLYGVLCTDGVKYVMDNGYHWFVSDAVIAIKENKIENNFLSINLDVDKEKHTAKTTVTDGDEKVLYEQKYSFTDAEVNLKLFYTDNVLMLSGEY